MSELILPASDNNPELQSMLVIEEGQERPDFDILGYITWFPTVEVSMRQFPGLNMISLVVAGEKIWDPAEIKVRESIYGLVMDSLMNQSIRNKHFSLEQFFDVIIKPVVPLDEVVI